MPQSKPLPDRDWLLENLRYEPETGLFWWKKSRGKCMAFAQAGCQKYQHKSGEPAAVSIKLQDKDYQAHRLAWRIMTGEDPGDMTIDHINRSPFDNRWSNLRLANHSLQQRNKRNHGASKFKGVSFNKKAGKWVASVWICGAYKYLGAFATEAEAAAVAAPYFIH